MKTFKLRNKLAVILNDGTTLHKECDEEQYQQALKLVESGDEEAVIDFMKPNYKKAVETRVKAIENFENFRNSELFSVKGQSIYIESISQLSVPQDLANRILEAEKSGNQNLLQAYLNFWTLTCTNPDSRVRQNMFWFLNKYGMTITSSGLFVSYRNVCIKREGHGLQLEDAKKISEKFYQLKFNEEFEEGRYVVLRDSYGTLVIEDIDTFENDLFYMYVPEKNQTFEEGGEEYVFLGYLEEMYKNLSEEDFATTFTDGYTRTFNIKIGEPVTMSRKACDSVQENSCSRGLHVAGRDWLQANYFGDVGLMVLVNPADVVAVPPVDDYGKMRTCAYYPVKIVTRDENGNIEEENIPDGFEDDFFEIISYTGVVDDSDSEYKYEIPFVPELNRNTIIDRLEEISKKLKQKTIK